MSALTTMTAATATAMATKMTDDDDAASSSSVVSVDAGVVADVVDAVDTAGAADAVDAVDGGNGDGDAGIVSNARPIRTKKASSTYNPPSQHFPNYDVTTDKPTVNDGAPKGRNVSNRPWKTRPQKRASSLVLQTCINRRSKSWQRKQEERAMRVETRRRQDELKEEKAKAIRERKERRLENERRRAENEFRNSQRSAQRLGKNADIKMKAMNKKQLRQIKKTRLNAKTGAMEYVSAYAK